MRIWIIRSSEPTPYDAGADNRRLGRYSHLAAELARAGHEVLWWTDDFDHYKKVHRFGMDEFREVVPGISVQWLHTPGYSKNISLRRFRDHRLLARKIVESAARHPAPDIILCCMPADTLCKAAAELGERFRCPVVLDVRDLWPDVFYARLPRLLRPLLRLYTCNMRKRLSFAFSRAAAIFGTSPGFVNWGLAYAGREKTEFDRDFPISSPLDKPADAAVAKAFEFWRGHGIAADNPPFLASFMGAFSSMYRFDAVIEAARLLKDEKNVRIVLCGKGPLENEIRRQVRDLPNVILPGWIHYPEVWSLLKMSGAGLCPYYDEENFSLNMPNKPGEYISAGLPILSSVDGYLGGLLKSYQCGFVYTTGRELADHIRTLSRNPETHARMCGNTRTLFQEKFDAAVIYREMRMTLEKTAGRQPPA
jgi:glycosyltransferase involved in cell wall biosynthesis